MINRRQVTILPHSTYMLRNEKKCSIAAIETILNEQIQKYEIKLLKSDKIISSYEMKSMTIKIIHNQKSDQFSLNISEKDNDDNQFELYFIKKLELSELQKYVDTIII